MCLFTRSHTATRRGTESPLAVRRVVQGPHIQHHGSTTNVQFADGMAKRFHDPQEQFCTAIWTQPVLVLALLMLLLHTHFHDSHSLALLALMCLNPHPGDKMGLELETGDQATWRPGPSRPPSIPASFPGPVLSKGPIP